MIDLTGFQRDVLYVAVSLDAPTGARIKNELEAYHEISIHDGHFYPNLDVLVDRGLINKEPKNQRANTYLVTDRGYEILRERHAWKRDRLESDPESATGG